MHFQQVQTHCLMNVAESPTGLQVDITPPLVGSVGSAQRAEEREIIRG